MQLLPNVYLTTRQTKVKRKKSNKVSLKIYLADKTGNQCTQISTNVFGFKTELTVKLVLAAKNCFCV